MNISSQVNEVLFPIHPHVPKMAFKQGASMALLSVYRLWHLASSLPQVLNLREAQERTISERLRAAFLPDNQILLQLAAISSRCRNRC
jgi:hypothetical protein